MKSPDPEFDQKCCQIRRILRLTFGHPEAKRLIVWMDEKAPIVVKEYGGRHWTSRRRPKIISGQEIKGIVEMFVCYLPQLAKVHARYFAERTSRETLCVLNYIVGLYPAYQLIVIWDNRSIHNRAKRVKKWIQKHQDRVQVYNLPIQASWLNPVERYFGLIDDQVLDNSNFPDREQLIRALKDHVAETNRRGVHIRSPLDP